MASASLLPPSLPGSSYSALTAVWKGLSFHSCVTVTYEILLRLIPSVDPDSTSGSMIAAAGQKTDHKLSFPFAL